MRSLTASTLSFTGFRLTYDLDQRAIAGLRPGIAEDVDGARKLSLRLDGSTRGGAADGETSLLMKRKWWFRLGAVSGAEPCSLDTFGCFDRQGGRDALTVSLGILG